MTNTAHRWVPATKAPAEVPGTTVCFWRKMVKEGRVPIIKVGPKVLIDIEGALECLTIQPTTNTTMREREAG